MTELSERTVELLLRRAEDPERYEQWRQAGARTGWCRHPVRLTGSSATADTNGEVVTTFSSDDLPDRTLLKACGQRRATVCPSCSATYRGDAFHLIASGLRGGKGVPEAITEHPAAFATLTAPSFGAVHSARGDGAGSYPCHLAPTPCEHRVRCAQVHGRADEVVGQPLCPPCWDYAGAILWNAHVTDLWRRTTIETRRALARAAGVSERRLRQRVRVAYSKVVEYQQRGLVHIHASSGWTRWRPLTRPRNRSAPPSWSPASSTPPHPCGRPHRRLGCPMVPAGEANWTCTISTPAGPARPPLTWPSTPRSPPTRKATSITASAAVRSTVWMRSSTPTWLGLSAQHGTSGHGRRLEHLGLRRWAHTVGFRGHWLTKSRAYSTTFSALRAERQAWHHRPGWESADEDSFSVSNWEFRGLGWLTPADQVLAEQAAKDHLAARRAGWEER